VQLRQTVPMAGLLAGGAAFFKLAARRRPPFVDAANGFFAGFAVERGGLWSVPRMRQVCSVMGEASPEGTSPPPSAYSYTEKSTRKLTQQAPQVVQADISGVHAAQE
jgi:hypothetical protein